MRIEVLGTGCAKCQKLQKVTEDALQSLGCPQTDVEKITDINKIMECGAMLTPALAVDGKLLTSGRVPTPEEVALLIEPYI